MTKPAVVLVHGFWGDAAHWTKVILELDRRGYESLHAVENPLTALADDARRTQQMVRQYRRPRPPRRPLLRRRRDHRGR